MKKGIYLIIILCIALVSQTVIATPPSKPCDEKIYDKEFYNNTILSNDIIKRINNEMMLYKILIDDCFASGRLQISLYYKLPENFSSYKIIYSDELILSYLKNGSIEIGYGGEDGVLSYDKAIGMFKNKISEIEGDNRVQEFILKLNPKTGSLIDINSRIFSDDYWIEYSRYSKIVRGYLLPNSIEWKQFPEIGKSHEIIEQNLLIGELSNCSIGKGDTHSYTNAESHDNENSPWFLTVALICENGWREAFLQLNSDGSYERLELNEYNNIKPTSSFNTNQIYSYLMIFSVLIILILFISFLFFRRKKLNK